MKHENRIIQEISLDSIDIDDVFFKITRNRISEKITRSIMDFGLIENPVLMKNGKKYVILFGHNRLMAFESSGNKTAVCEVLEKIDMSFFTRQSVLKCMRNEIGPVGKIKALTILAEYFKSDSEHLFFVGKRGFNLPDEFIENSELRYDILNMSGNIKEYLDGRDVNFRIIKTILKLSEGIKELLSSWVGMYAIRVKVFRELVEMLYDIERAGGSWDSLLTHTYDKFTEPRQFEQFVYESVYSIRYPEYYPLKSQAEMLAGSIRQETIQVDYPGYFQDKSIFLKIKIDKDADLDEVSLKVHNLLKNSKLKELLKLF